jgi:hypothetical protein
VPAGDTLAQAPSVPPKHEASDGAGGKAAAA